MAMGSLNYGSSNADKDVKLHEDSENDNEMSRPSSSQPFIVSLLEGLKSPIPAEILQN